MVIHRDIKFPRIEFKTGRPLIILPIGYRRQAEFFEKHRKWMRSKTQLIHNAAENSNEMRLEEGRTQANLEREVTQLIYKYSKELLVNIARITFKKMRSKWASCSNKMNIALNTLLVYLPWYLVEYVVYHEMIHVFERKHNGRFWRIIQKKFRQYKKYEKELLVYWIMVHKNQYV
jgi:predicted metal-dependent hydrolase